ncbi:MAG: transposase [Pirellula sp.]
MSITGINVVSAAGFAGEAGPIEHYATARAITGRAGLFPTRYHSDEVDRANGAVARTCVTGRVVVAEPASFWPNCYRSSYYLLHRQFGQPAASLNPPSQPASLS